MEVVDMDVNRVRTAEDGPHGSLLEDPVHLGGHSLERTVDFSWYKLGEQALLCRSAAHPGMGPAFSGTSEELWLLPVPKLMHPGDRSP